MKLDCVLTACNLNPQYLDFIPLFIRSWKKVLPNIQITVVLVADEIPSELADHCKHIVLFPPIEGVSTAFTSQYIRLLYPALLDLENDVMISDVDMMPLNADYFTKNIEKIPDNGFVYLRDVFFQNEEISMCYNVASPQVWGDIFNVATLADIRDRLIQVFTSINHQEIHGGQGWGKDQLDLYKAVTLWADKTKRFHFLKDKESGFHRLEGKLLPFKRWSLSNFLLHRGVRKKVKSGVYSDFHARAPHSEYLKFNETIIDLL